jgi:HEAT repeat-containing protein 5
MSNHTPNTGHDEIDTATPSLDLDISKLHSLPSEQQDLFLLTFVSDLVRHVQGLDNDTLSAQKASIKNQLTKILNLSSPAPSRPINDSLGILYTEIFARGSRSLLYESITELLDVINAVKGEKELKNRHAAVVCLGRILQSAGGSAVGISTLALGSLLRLLKQAQNHTGLRAAIYKALGRAAEGLGSSVDEQSAREVWKAAKAAASIEKAMLCQKSACYCLERLVVATAYFDNTTDFDALKITTLKTFESTAASVRHAAAFALASTLVKFFSEIEAPLTSRKQTKGLKKTNAGLPGEDDVERPRSSASKKQVAIPSLTLVEILRTLAGNYTKASTSNRARAAITFCYKQVLRRLPERIVEEHYGVVASHLFYEILNNPVISHNRHRLLLTRKFVRAILDTTVGFKILGESAQINATQWLLNDVLKDYPQSIPERREPPKQVIVAALASLSSLVSFLGPAAGSIAEECQETLLQLLSHPSYSVQIHVAHCFRALVFACPQQLLISANSCMEEMKKAAGQLTESRLCQRRCSGYAIALATIVSTSRFHPLYGSVDLFSQVLQTATELLKASGGTELRVSATQIQVAWTLVGGLMALGPNFVKVHLSQLLLLWRNALPNPLTNNTSTRGTLEMSFLAHVRECALGALLVFLDYNGSLITTDGARRIAAMLQNTISFDESVPVQKQPDELVDRLTTALQLQNLMVMVRRRVLQCFAKLINLSHFESAGILSNSNLLALAIEAFAEPGTFSPQNLESLINISASTFESVWDVTDNWGYGVNGLIRGCSIEALGRDSDRKVLGDLDHVIGEERGVDDAVRIAPGSGPTSRY